MSTLHGLQSSTEIAFYKITFIEFYEYPLYTLHRIWHAFKAERKENRYGYQKSLSFWPLNKNNNEKDETTVDFSNLPFNICIENLKPNV